MKDLPPAVLLSLTLGMGMLLLALIKAVAWFFKQWWSERKERLDRQSQALMANTIAIVKLETQIERLNEFLHIIPRLKADIDLAHQKIRDLSK